MTPPDESIGRVNEAGQAVSVYVIMGAAVWPDGRASNAMKRRVEGALLSAQGKPNPVFLVTGGIGKYPPSEAALMSSLLREAGIPDRAILVEDASRDTLQSIRNSVLIIRKLPNVATIVVCSDLYHIPRCRWLFKLYGLSTQAGQVRSGWPETPITRWLYYCAREVAALPWDSLVTLISAKP